MDPCPAPPAGAVTETASVFVIPPVSSHPLMPFATGTVLPYRPPQPAVQVPAPVDIALNADGSWSGEITIPVQPAGVVDLEASCLAFITFPGPMQYAGYTLQTFIVSTSGDGYWLAETSSGEEHFPAAIGFGDAGNNEPFGYIGGASPDIKGAIGGIAGFPLTGAGYWVFGGSNGEVLPHGDAPFLGDNEPMQTNAAVVGIAATPDGKGYWLASADGGVFAYGTASFLGSEGGRQLNAPVVGIAATPDGKGYWLAAADGGVFAFGNASFLGSAAGTKLNQPIVGMSATPNGGGYWLAAAEGGVFAFGDAAFSGSAAKLHLNRRIVGIAAHSGGRGYWLAAADGGVFAFGGAPFLGSGVGLASLSGTGPASFAAIASTPRTAALTETVGAGPAPAMFLGTAG